MAYVNPLGYYELYVNGKKVDDHVLSPGGQRLLEAEPVCDPRHHRLPGRGQELRGAVAGPRLVCEGSSRASFTTARWCGRSSSSVQPDGSTERIGTDATWKVRESPLTPLGRGTAFGDYGGERYDPAASCAGWNTADLDDSDWQAAALFDPPKVVTAAQMVEPNRIAETIRPVKVSEPTLRCVPRRHGPELHRLVGTAIPAGASTAAGVKLEYADFPPSGGRLVTNNQRDEVIPREGVEQTFCSRFNYHAFSLVRITGLKRPPSLEDIKGYLIHTAYRPAAEFECSNDLFNRIYQTITWTYRCLTLGGYVVDCPHRERLGYGGDAGTSLETGMFNFATAALYTKWTANWRGLRRPETGDLPYTAPNYQDQGGGGPMWSGFIVTLPWQLYLQYGDRRILEISYPNIQKWLAFAETKTVDHVLEFYKSYGMRMAEWNFLGDWVSPRHAGQETRSCPGPGDGNVDQQLPLPLHAPACGQDRHRPGEGR